MRSDITEVASEKDAAIAMSEMISLMNSKMPNNSLMRILERRAYSNLSISRIPEFTPAIR